MAYELRISGIPIRTFDTEEEALEHARAAMQERPESEPEIFDTSTGKPVAPLATKVERDDLATKVGF